MSPMAWLPVLAESRRRGRCLSIRRRISRAEAGGEEEGRGGPQRRAPSRRRIPRSLQLSGKLLPGPRDPRPPISGRARDFKRGRGGPAPRRVRGRAGGRRGGDAAAWAPPPRPLPSPALPASTKPPGRAGAATRLRASLRPVGRRGVLGPPGEAGSSLGPVSGGQPRVPVGGCLRENRFPGLGRPGLLGPSPQDACGGGRREPALSAVAGGLTLLSGLPSREFRA